MKPIKLSAFTTGGPNDAFADFFAGRSYLNMLSTEQVVIGNVTFEPGCRNNWHIHHADQGGGQILMVTAGRGWYQAWGQEARELRPGDVVHIPAGVKHWHGAAADSWFQHLAVEVPAVNGRNEWLEPVSGEEYARLKASAPDRAFLDIQKPFLEHEIAASGLKDKKTASLVRLACLTALPATGELAGGTREALAQGASVTEIKETLYQTAPYAGYPRVAEALAAVNAALEAEGLSPVGEERARVTAKNRLEEGLAVQRELFGRESIDQMRASAPAGTRHIQDCLSAHCFGDHYTRGELDLKLRELITFTALCAMGGCDPQVRSHAGGNLRVGNDRETLIQAVTTCLPYIGYPKTLNALRAIDEAAAVQTIDGASGNTSIQEEASI